MRSTSAADGGVVAADAALALPGELERGGRCLRCERGGTCRSCGQRRRRAWRLAVVEGLSYREAGERMGLTPERVRLLVGQERDHRDLKRFRLNFVATESVRAFVERELQRDQELTHAKLAEFIGMRQIDLERQLGRGGQPADDRPRPRPARARRLLNHPRARLPHRPARRRALPGTRRPWPRRPAGSAGA